jgi:hypothetical protein
MLCNYPKGASTSWRKVFTLVVQQQNTSKPNPNFAFARGDKPSPSSFGLPIGSPDKVDRVVFLRDPLERFLSAFLDKCHHSFKRDRERHCWPMTVFTDQSQSPIPELFMGSAGASNDNKEKKKLIFEAYVDAMPLQWNAHFVPQSFFCEGPLFRNFESSYDSVIRRSATMWRRSLSCRPSEVRSIRAKRRMLLRKCWSFIPPIRFERWSWNGPVSTTSF